MSLTPLGSLLLAVVVLLVGTLVNRSVTLLSKYNIPDPITGGLLFAALASVVAAAAGFRLGIDQTLKPVLLLMFFAGVGMSADLRMLTLGGKALAIFLVVLFPYILVQDAVGVGVATLLDLHPIFGLVGGSITLVGGHGTGAAYAERFAEVNNLQAVMGSTATAMANMQAITAKYGPAPRSHLIVPLAGAFFIDLMNAFVLTLLLALPFIGG